MKQEEKAAAKAAAIIMLSTVASRLLGFIRDMAIAYLYGQSRYSDVYQAAFSIPDAIYMILVGGAFSAAFIPVFSHYLVKKQTDTAWEVASISLNVICCLMVVLLSLAYVFIPNFVGLVFSDFDAEKLQFTVFLTRLMLIQVIFMALAGICSAIQQSFNRFGPTAWGGLAYNAAIILVGIGLSGVIERHFPGYGITAFSIGVIVGALANLLIQIFSLHKVKMRYSFSFNFRHPGFLKMMYLMAPVLIGLSANQVGLFVNLNLASGLRDGLLTALTAAQRFMQLPVSIFAISIAMTLFPVLNRKAAEEDMPGFRRDFAYGLRSILFVCIPSSVFLGVLAVPLIRFLYQNGQFTPENTANTAFALYFYAIGIFAQGGIHLCSRAFYALQNTAVPVKMAVTGIAVNIIGSILLVRVLSHGGLALAYSISGIINLALLMFSLRRRTGQLHGREIMATFLKTTILSFAAGIAAWITAQGSAAIFGIDSKWAQGVQLFGSGIAGCLLFFGLALAIKMPEATVFLNTLRKRLRRKQKQA